MAYNSILTGSGYQVAQQTSGTGALVPLEYSKEIISLLPAQSVALKNFRHINMGTVATQVPVLDVLPEAYWVGQEGVPSDGTPGTEGSYGALKQTTNLAWKGVILTAQELAVIVPISNNLLADAAFPIVSEAQPLIAGALALALDRATVFGLNSPFAAQGIVPGSVAVGNTETIGTHTAETGGIANDISQLFDKVEAGSGFDVNGIIASKALKAVIRNARTTFGQELGEVSTSEWYEQDVDYLAIPGGWPGAPSAGLKGTVAEKTKQVTLTTGETTSLSVGDVVTITGVTGSFTITSIDSTTKFSVNHEFTKADQEATSTKVAITETRPVAVAGDMSQALLGVRQDIAFEVFREGVVTDAQGRVVLNLMQQDSSALRVTARFGFAVANSVTYYQPNSASRYPFATLLK